MRLFKGLHSAGYVVCTLIIFLSTLAHCGATSGGNFSRSGTCPQAASTIVPGTCQPIHNVSGSSSGNPHEGAINPSVASTRRGDGIAVWQELVAGTLENGTFNIFASTYDVRSDSWSTPYNLSAIVTGSEGTDARDPQAAIDDCGHALVAWRQSVSYDDINHEAIYNVFINSYDTCAQKWSQPVDISEDTAANASGLSVTLNECCKGAITWQETTPAHITSVTTQRGEVTIDAVPLYYQDTLTMATGPTRTPNAVTGSLEVDVIGQVNGNLAINPNANNLVVKVSPAHDVSYEGYVDGNLTIGPCDGNVDVTLYGGGIQRTVARGYEACIGNFGMPFVLGSSPSSGASTTHVALDDEGHGVVVWRTR